MNELMAKCMERAQALTRAYSEKYYAATDAICGGGTPPPPPNISMPQYAPSAREGILADVESLPARKIIEAAARAGTKGTTSIGGQEISYDFTGVGDLQQQAIGLEAQRRSADAIAAMGLDIQRRYGKQYNLEQLARIKEADPVGFEMRQELGRTTLEQLAKGSELTEAQAKQAEESVRGAQAARGNVLGPANIAQEALAKFDMGQRMLLQRQHAAQAYVMGQPITAQYGMMGGAQQGAAMFAPQQMQQGLAQNPNAMAMGTQFATQNYGTQMQGAMSAYNTQVSNTSNPWMEALGMVTGVVAQGAGGWAMGRAMRPPAPTKV